MIQKTYHVVLKVAIAPIELSVVASSEKEAIETAFDNFDVLDIGEFDLVDGEAFEQEIVTT